MISTAPSLTTLITVSFAINLWGKRASGAWYELTEGDPYLAIPAG